MTLASDLESIYTVFGFPGSKHRLADAISKLNAHDYHSFTRFGPHTTDRYASAFNVGVSPGRYNPLYFELAAECLNAFAKNCASAGTSENDWIHPHRGLMAQALCHYLAWRARGALVLPI
jgi:hypothetical protein